jgi:hypothetical protein
MSPAYLLALMIGLYAGLLQWRPAAFILIGAICAQIATHVALGVSSYRHVMSRPWPKVPPIADDDW